MRVARYGGGARPWHGAWPALHRDAPGAVLVRVGGVCGHHAAQVVLDERDERLVIEPLFRHQHVRVLEHGEPVAAVAQQVRDGGHGVGGVKIDGLAVHLHVLNAACAVRTGEGALRVQLHG